MSNNELHAVIKELKEFKFLKEESEERISELENTIKSEMRTQEVDKMMVVKCKHDLESQIFNSEFFKMNENNIQTLILIFINDLESAAAQIFLFIVEFTEENGGFENA